MASTAQDMSPIRVPSNLPELVRAAFSKAKASGDLTYYPTEVALLHINSIPFQLRFSPSLANKPKAPQRHPQSSKPLDPFADPPPALFVTALPPHHNLLLNKFAVVPEHSILATTAFAEQDHLLAATDLAAAAACLAAYHADGAELFAFFNSGPASGASQPHRHLQLLPVARMRDGLPPGAAWDVLAACLGDEGGEMPRRLPFRTFGARLDGTMDGARLRDVYLGLYRRACVAAGVAEGEEGEPAADAEGRAMISYNLALTRDVMVLCPRVAEGASLAGREGGEVGRLSLNGTLLAGTALVKNQEEWDALREEPDKLLALLGKIGVLTEAGVAGEFARGG